MKKYMEENYQYLMLIDQQEFQRRVIECINSDEFNKFFDATVFKDKQDNQGYKQAMMHGMVIASMMTSYCKKIFVREDKIK